MSELTDILQSIAIIALAAASWYAGRAFRLHLEYHDVRDLESRWHTDTGASELARKEARIAELRSMRSTLEEMKNDRETFAKHVLNLKPGTEEYESYVRGEWNRHDLYMATGKTKP